jgi:hypothetical protein
MIEVARVKKKLGPSFWRNNGRGIRYTYEIGEAADRLGITIDAAKRRLLRGQLKGFKVDGQWYVVIYHPPRRWWRRSRGRNTGVSRSRLKRSAAGAAYRPLRSKDNGLWRGAAPMRA